MLNQVAPNFSLPDQNGINRSLTEFRGRWVVLYFYPKNATMECTLEACSFRDEHAIIAQFGNAEVIGVSKDSVATQKEFADTNHLNFPILSDTELTVLKAYGAWNEETPPGEAEYMRTQRSTFIINPEGVVVKVYSKVNPEGHAQQIIDDLHTLESVPN
jgi:peroxiredoxin Q/BCP